MSGIDDLIKQMQLDEAEDATKAKPITYAKLRGLYPQRVYKAIRDRKLKLERCQCGGPIIDIEAADKVFKVGRHAVQGTVENVPEEEEVSGSDVDTDE